MKIFITTGLAVSDVGGPAQYGFNLSHSFKEFGHKVELASYGRLERILPVGLRHICFFLRILPKVYRADSILALDTFSTGVPTVLAASLFKRKVIVRVGGDFLWSDYVNNYGGVISIPDFYKNIPELKLKQKIILSFTKILCRKSNLAFTTEWHKSIWKNFYEIKSSEVVRNFVPKKQEGEMPAEKVFLWAGRDIPEKNLESLERAARIIAERHPEFKLRLVTGKSHDEILDMVKNCYAVVSVAVSDVCPNFIIEGISFNKPFVMTRETGLFEIYPKGGIFIDPRDEKEIESAIEALLNPEVYNDSVEALKSNNFSHSWREMAEEFIEIWKKI